MNDDVVIVSVDEAKIYAVPLLTGACINCEKSGCAKKGKPFLISNPAGFPISIGSVVKIRSNKTSKILQGFFALILPIAAAIGFYFLGGFLCLKYGWKNEEMSKALSSLIGLILVSVVVFAVNAKSHKLRKSEIYEIVS